MVAEKLDFEPSGLAELVVAEHSRSRRSRCSLCRMAGGGLSSRLHFTSCRMQAEQGLFSSHCHGVSSRVSTRSISCGGGGDSRHIVGDEGVQRGVPGGEMEDMAPSCAEAARWVMANNSP